MRRCNSCEKCSDCRKSETRSKASLLISIAPSRACSASTFCGAMRAGGSAPRDSSRAGNCSTFAIVLLVASGKTRTPTQGTACLAASLYAAAARATNLCLNRRSLRRGLKRAAAGTSQLSPLCPWRGFFAMRSRDCRLTPAGLKFLHPRPQLDLPSPGAARLTQHMQISLGDGVGIEHRVGPIRRLGPARIADRAVDDEMRDVDCSRRKLARHALGEAAQSEFAHREGRGLGIALYARRGASEQDRAFALGEHAPRRLLSDEE